MSIQAVVVTIVALAYTLLALVIAWGFARLANRFSARPSVKWILVSIPFVILVIFFVLSIKIPYSSNKISW